MINLKHADELLQDIWKQRRDIYLKTFKPKMQIWMNKIDVQTIMIERMDLFLRDEFSRSMYPTRLFGETLIASDDTLIGQPFVEEIHDKSG